MFTLSEQDRYSVKAVIKTGDSARLINRAHALNLRDKGMTPMEIADMLECTPRTVINITQHYLEGGLRKALEDDPRPGRPLKFDARTRSRVVATVCSDPPEGFDRWTLELLKAHVEQENIVDRISKESIRMVLQEHDLKPWQEKMWCIAELDQQYIERMEDVLDVYERDYDPAYPVVCVDEKPVLLHGEIREPIAAKPGSVRKRDTEYTRHGTANVFCAVQPKKGDYVNTVTARRTGDEFAKFLDELSRRYSQAQRIVLVMDNLNTHAKKSLTRFYGEQRGGELWERFEVHYTPKHGSWLNQAEIAIGMYSRQCLGSSRTESIETLTKKTKAWNRIANRKKVTIEWAFTKRDAREKFKYE